MSDRAFHELGEAECPECGNLLDSSGYCSWCKYQSHNPEYIEARA